MQVRKFKTIWIVGTGLILAVSFLLSSTNIPEHAGRPVRAWFEELCSGVWVPSAKGSGFDAAYAEFSQVESNAIPYLTQQLRYDRTGFRQKIMFHLRQYAVSKSLADNLIWPVERRNYAAVALRRMGPKAVAAIPALIEACENDLPEVKLNAVAALESILGRQPSEGLRPAEWKEVETNVIAEAVQFYRKFAEGLDVDRKAINQAPK